MWRARHQVGSCRQSCAALPGFYDPGRGRPASQRCKLPVPGFLLVLFWIFSAVAARAEHYTFAQFGQTDGLLNQDVSAIVQDNEGVLWVGTENGVFLADGSHFVKMESFRDAVEGQVLAMHVDSLGRVWVLGSRHLVFFTQDHAMHGVSGLELGILLDDETAIASLPGDPSRLYLLLNGRLQQVRSTDNGTTWGVSPLFSDRELAERPVLGKLTGLTGDARHHALWTGCDSGICELTPPEPEAINVRTAVTAWDTNRGVPQNHWNRLLVARDGQVWARGERDVLRLDPHTWAVDRYGDPSGGKDASDGFSRIVEDADGSILTNMSVGVARLKDGRWTRMMPADGLPSSQIATMFFDQQGGFWLAPEGQGIWRWLGYNDWQHWTNAEGLVGSVTWSLLRDKAGKLWIAGRDDLYSLSSDGDRVVPQSSGAPIGQLQALAMDARGHLWLGNTAGSVYDFDPSKQHARKLPQSFARIYRIGTDGNGGRVWLCTPKGVFWLSSADNWTDPHPVIDADAPHSNVWTMTEGAAGALWFTAKGGLYRFADNQWHLETLPPDVQTAQYPSLEAAPDGTLWMQGAMPNPLLHLRDENGEAKLIGTVTGAMLGSDDISFIKHDRRGWMWVGTDIGVYVTDGQRWVHATQEDGLLSDDTDTGGVLADVDGSMWFGTVAGLSHLIDPPDLYRVPAPEIGIRDVRLHGKKMQTGDHPRLDVRNPSLSVQLFSTDYTRSRAVVFRYRLLGLENDWQVVNGNGLYFSGLPPGEYTLSLQAMDRRVHTFSAPVNYTFTVLPPWYRRDRAKILALLLCFVLGAVWWKLSLHRLRTSEANLKAKVDRQTAQLLAEKEQLERAQRELVETARKDALTGLLNRSAIFEVLGRMRRTALETGQPLSVVMADLDHFKSINDRWGHAVGDAVLRECAERLRETLRPGDAVGRYGGEEVLIVIPGLNPAHAVSRLEEIRAVVAGRPVVHGSHSLYVTCSFGAAWLNGGHRDVESVVNEADAALYLAKQNGRNRVEFAPAAIEEIDRSVDLLRTTPDVEAEIR